MKQIIILLLLLISVTIFQAQTRIDTTNYAIFKHDSKINWCAFDKKYKPYNLTENDILEIETILSNCIKKYNLSQTKEYNQLNKKKPQYHFNIKTFIIELSKYKQQIVAVINSRGEKEVWVNCFRPFTNFNFNYWRQKIVQVEDGGNYFFNVKINLTTKKFYDFRVNGLA